MGLGNNRDYVTAERTVKRRLAVVTARAKELVSLGMDQSTATFQAMEELKAGELKAQLKAWVDPVLAHRRAMKAKRNENA